MQHPVCGVSVARQKTQMARHVFRMPNDRLPKKLLFDQVKGLRPPGRPRSSFYDVALYDCQTRRIGRPYRDAQDRLPWKDKTCAACT